MFPICISYALCYCLIVLETQAQQAERMEDYLKTYPLTDDTLGARLETFKQRVDNTVTMVGDSIEYKQRGGLSFLKVGKLNLSWSISKPKRATKPVKYTKPSEPIISRPVETTTVNNWRERMRIGTRMGLDN